MASMKVLVSGTTGPLGRGATAAFDEAHAIAARDPKPAAAREVRDNNNSGLACRRQAPHTLTRA
jgi:hypothetical protein